jgi:ABC-2 type transport system ATP-binding protein
MKTSPRVTPEDSMTVVVAAEQVVKRYPGAASNAVDGVTFEVPEGQAVGILGPNGAGKTTLIKLICGVAPPTSGQLTLLGSPPTDSRTRRHLGVVHQEAPFDNMLSCWDNLRIAAAFRGLRWRGVRDHVDRLLEAFDLTAVMDQLAFTLSGGQKRRLQVVRALLRVPRLLLLDEPSSGMDARGRRQVWTLLRDLREHHHTTILWTSHHIEELERNCDRILLIDHGRLATDASPRALVEAHGQQTVLLHLAEMDDATAALAVIEGLGFTATCHDEVLQLPGLDPIEHLPDLLAALRAESLPITSVDIQRSTLEDVFLALTGHRATTADADQTADVEAEEEAAVEGERA